MNRLGWMLFVGLLGGVTSFAVTLLSGSNWLWLLVLVFGLTTYFDGHLGLSSGQPKRYRIERKEIEHG